MSEPTTIEAFNVSVNATKLGSGNGSGSGSVREEDGELDVTYAAFEGLVALLAVVGNAMVIIVFKRERRLRRRTNFYIVSLATADFLVGLLGVPFAVLSSVGLPRNLHACLFTISLLIVLCTISIFCLVAVSLDRYWAILYPMAYSRNVRTKTAIVIISMCWLAGSIIGFLPLFGWHETPKADTCLFVKVMDYDYLVFLYFSTIITPALLLLAFYAHIYRVIVRQLRQIVTMNPIGSSSRSGESRRFSEKSTRQKPIAQSGTMLRVLGPAQKREVKATQNLSIIVLFFMICWVPLYTINCIMAFCRDCQIHPTVMLFCIILSHLNSAVNPLLYAYHLKDFRAALKNLILSMFGYETNTQDLNYRLSLASQQQMQNRQSVKRCSLQARVYTDSPIDQRMHASRVDHQKQFHCNTLEESHNASRRLADERLTCQEIVTMTTSENSPVKSCHTPSQVMWNIIEPSITADCSHEQQLQRKTSADINHARSAECDEPLVKSPMAPTSTELALTLEHSRKVDEDGRAISLYGIISAKKRSQSTLELGDITKCLSSHSDNDGSVYFIEKHPVHRILNDGSEQQQKSGQDCGNITRCSSRCAISSDDNRNYRHACSCEPTTPNSNLNRGGYILKSCSLFTNDWKQYRECEVLSPDIKDSPHSSLIQLFYPNELQTPVDQRDGPCRAINKS